jgi:hypothetical protein
LEVSGFSQCFQEPFRHLTAFWAIEITTELLFVGMAVATLCASFSSHLTVATSLLQTTDQAPIWDDQESIGGLDSGIITIIELSARRRQHRPA